MKRVLNYLKNNRLPIPIRIGVLLSKINYSKRPGVGKLYDQQKLAIKNFPLLSQKDQEEFIYMQFMKVFVHAYYNVKFYQDLYRKHNITPEDIRSFCDIKKVPIITKQDLIKYNLEDRSYPIKNRLIVNTGGSSGKALAFYMDPNRYGNEWAHVHDMWAKFGFLPSDLKLSFDGRVKENHEIVYDFARHSLLFDIYAPPEILREKLLKLLKSHHVKYFHGYPSAIYEFALYCENDKELLKSLRKRLKAVFLSSEYPSPHYRQKIEEVFGVPSQSFYGHTETCIMAVEGEQFVYEVYQTYGYAECIKIEDKNHLVGTSYFNFASPLIRYDTSDLIESLNSESNILKKFAIKEGRSGEFVVDINNKKISLTGLIYGRHHELFNVSEHIQVFQPIKGKMVILYVTNKEIDENIVNDLFDKRNINIEVSFKRISKPILTKSGKTNLLINKEQFENII